jgi:carboxymethylenebutenolidase
MNVRTDWQTVTVDDSPMRLFIARPEAGKRKRPAMLVIQEAFGVNEHIRDVTARIATLGYIAAAPELFHRTAPPGFEGAYSDFQSVAPHMRALTEATLSADLRAAHGWLCADAEVDKAHVGAVGYCLGGRAAWLANAVLPLGAAICYYGGQIAPALLPRANDQHGPVLLFWGGKDAHIDIAQRRAVSDALRQIGKSFVEVEFSDADHAFFCDARTNSHAPSARQSWALLQAFLAEYLPTSP